MQWILLICNYVEVLLNSNTFITVPCLYLFCTKYEKENLSLSKKTSVEQINVFFFIINLNWDIWSITVQ